MAVSRAWRLLLGLALSGIAIGALPALASAATISGTVTGAPGNVALEGVGVCSHVEPYTFEDTCAQTGAGGHYSLAGLPAGEYSIQFSDRRLNRNYVDQYYGGAVSYPGTRITVAGAENRTGIDIELPAGSSITGTVTDVDTHAPIAGIFACPFAEAPGYQRCDETDAAGNFQANGLPPGEYRVEFQPGFLNYQEQELPSSGDPKIVISGANETKGPVDAEMKVGAEISGTLTEAGTGKPVPNMLVELIHPMGIEGETRQAFTDANGHYAFRALREAEDVIVFSPAKGPFGTDDDGYGMQYYKGSATLAGATVLHAIPGIALTGIDGEVVNLHPPKEPVKVDLLPAPRLLPKHKPLRCHRGFKKRKVHGKPRCVKVHKHHKRKHHRSRS